MFFSKIRFLVAMFILIAAVIIHVKVGIGTAWYMYLAGMIILLTHFLFGNVLLAFSKLNKGKIEEAENLILQIKKPEWLLKSHRAYYYFILGMIALQRKQTGYGEQHLKKALDLGLRTKTDNALAALNIAHLNFVVKKDYKAANDYRIKAASFESEDLMIKENLQKLKEELAKGSN